MKDGDDFVQLQQYFLQGITLRMLEDISQEDMHSMACLGWQKISEGKYQQARNVFYVLVYCDHVNSDYLLSLGLCYQKLGDHHAAVLAFSQAGTFIITDPRPPFLAAQSYLALGFIDQTCVALEIVLKLINNQMIWHELHTEAAEQLLSLSANVK
jgi:secretion system chaperone SscA